jgi:hypothetical protein
VVLIGCEPAGDTSAWRTEGMTVLHPERGGIVVRAIVDAAHLGDLTPGWAALREELLHEA